MQSNRVGIEDTKDFLMEESYWRDGGFEVSRDIIFEEYQKGRFIMRFAVKGVAGLVQIYGPFIPTEGPMHAQMFTRAENAIAQMAEGAGVRYFLEYTPEAESYFLAFDYTSMPLMDEERMLPTLAPICHQLCVVWQGLENDKYRENLARGGRDAQLRGGVVSREWQE